MVSRVLSTKSASTLLPKKSARRNSSDLVNEIVDHIEIGILFGEYKPREHLIQDQLAEKYSAERNIVRAALKKLEEKSVIEHFPNRGSRVKEFTAKNAKDLYRLRFLLEGMAAEMSVAKMTSPTIRQLESLSEEMEKNLQEGKLKAFTLAHEKFHHLIFETANNFYLLKVIKELRSASASIRNFSYSRYSLPETKNQLFVEHKQMITSLKKGDKKKIGQISRSHIKAGLNYYLRNFFPQESQIV
jgi:DNA-binding GntR family transcriptional regulator